VKNQANSNCLFSENESNCEFDRSNHIATDSLQQNDTTAPNDDAVMQPISRLNISLKNRQEKYKKTNQNNIFTSLNAYKSSIELLQILKKCGTPLYLFDDIMSWANRSYWEYNFDFSASEIFKRDALLYKIKEQYDYSLIEPDIYKFKLPGSQVVVDMVVHDFLASLYTLLNDDALMKAENLLIDVNDPFHVPSKPTQNCEISDINSGLVWYKAYKRYIRPNSNQLLCPLIFFIDKTHTDRNGRLCIEQIRFTLGIFKRHIRNEPRSWRCLGYILDQPPTSGVYTATSKVEDYQAMVRFILSSYKKTR
jgi:hypothetical protein